MGFKHWCEHQMGHLDRILAQHPTWTIVVNNHKMKMDLQ